MFNTSISDPREIEKRGNEKVTDKQLAEVYPIATSEDELIRRIEEYLSCGFDHVYVQLNTFDDEGAIELFRTRVLPYFRR
jgi:alkanesulfonate monooxygenase SsuD/methylene tetrahydromethanopterin reductase-like flavin-dependent oxidoreductase (luciferase family)